MRKFILVTLAVFAVLFAYITLNNKSSSAESAKEESDYTEAEKEKVLKFWEYYRTATDYRMEEKWQQAADYYLKALEFNPVHEDALYYLGNMYLELLRYKDAEACWTKLAKINPQKSRAYLQLATLYLSSEEFFDIEKAENASRQALKNNKEETGPVLLLGEIKLIRGDLDAAADDFKAVTTSNFKSVDAYFLAGYIAWKKGDKTKARDLFLEAVKYAKPADNAPQKVEGEGDTKHGKGFGSVTSKSVFHPLIAQLAAVQPDQADKALQKAYIGVDALLVELKRRVN
jgi:tetratricopeptide (TPR) repeat protein